MARRMIHIDDSELRTLELDLSAAPGRMQRNARETLVKAGRIVNRGMREDAAGHRYLRRLPESVSFEMLDPWTVEIGHEPAGSRHQGSIAHIIAYGSVNNAPVYDHTAALRRNLPNIVRLFANAAEDSVLGGEKP